MAATSKKKYLRRAIAALMVIVALGVPLLFALLQTAPARRALERRFTVAASEFFPGPVQVEGLTGTIPTNMRIQSIRLEDTAGTWMTLEDVRVYMSAASLVRGQVLLRELSASKVDVLRAPIYAAEEDSQDEPFAMPALPELPSWLKVESFTIESLLIAEGITPKATTMLVEGSLDPAIPAPIQMTLIGLDDTELEATLSAGWRGGVHAVSLEVNDNSLSPHYLSTTGPLTLGLAVTGPVDNASWFASAILDGEALAELEGTLSLLAPMAIQLKGVLSPPDALYPLSLREQVGASFSVDADAQMAEGNRLRIIRSNVVTDLLNASATGHIELDSQQATLELLLGYKDISRWLSAEAIAESRPLQVKGKVQGGLEELALKLDATLSGEPWMNADATVQRSDGLSVRGALHALPVGGLLPAELATLMGSGADLRFDVAVEENALQITEAQLLLESAELSAQGNWAWGSGKADLVLRGDARDLAIFSGLAGTPLAGSVQLEGSVNGDGVTSRLLLSTSGEGLIVGEVRAPTVEIELGVGGGALDSNFADALEIQLNASAPGLALQPGLARDFVAEADVLVSSLQQLNVRKLVIDDGNLHAEAIGQVDLSTRLADFKASLLAEELAVYASPLGYPYGGRVDVELDLASSDQGGVIQLATKVSADKFSGLSCDVARLAGDKVALSANGDFDGAILRIKSIALDAGQLDVAGQGRYNMTDRTVEATMDASMVEVASLSNASGQYISGSVKGKATVTGTLDSLHLSGTLEPQDLEAGALRLDGGLLSFDISGIPAAMAGDVTVALRSGGVTLDGKAAFAQEDSSIVVSGLDIQTGENSLRAQGQWNSTTQRGSGSFDAEISELGQLQAWMNLPLEGGLSIKGTLSESGGLDTTFSIAALQVPGLLVGEAQGKAELQDLFSAPSGSVQLFASELKADRLAIARLDLNASGPATGMTFDVQTEGLYQDVLPFMLSGQGVTSTTLPLQMNLNALAAKLDETELLLESPVSLTATKDGYDLGAARMRVADGSITVQGVLTPSRVDGYADWVDLPLSLGAMVGMPPYEGRASGRVDLSGTQSEPIANAKFVLTGLRMPVEDGEAAALDARIEAKLAAGTMVATFDATVPDALESKGSISLPASWSLSPWEMLVAPDALLQGDFTAKGDLAAIPAILGVEDHVLRGEINADLRVAGTPDTPMLNGSLILTEGYYENFTSGTILDTLTARIEADGMQFKLTEFSAGDSVGGTITGTGELSLDAEENFPFTLQAELVNMRVVHRDEVSGQVGGPLSLSGDGDGAKVEGQLRVGPAYIAIPERMPEQKVTTVDFRVAGETESGEAPPAAQAPAAYPVALDLDCTIPRGVFVRGPGLDSEWAGDIKVGGTVQAPTLRGNLRVRQGKLAFLGRDFDLGESTVAFNGTSPPTPALNILAVAQQQDITARVRLEGELESLNITLSSDPPLPQDEVLSQVLFGRNLSEVTPFQALQLARYAPLFRSRVSGSGLLGSGGAKPGGLDRLGLQTGSDISDMSVTAGKSLSDDLYLEVEQGTGTKGTAVSLEWLFAPNWSLRGKTSTNSEGSAGLFWKKNY